MSIVKHSKRTLREANKTPKTCRDCGEAGFYWAHDTAVYAEPCSDPKCATAGKWVLINANADTRSVDPGSEVDPSQVHNVSCVGKREPAPVAPSPVVVPESPSKPLPVTPPTPVTPAPSASALDQFSGFLAAVKAEVADGLTNTVDAATVEQIVKTQLDGIVFPHTHTHEKLSGEVVEITGSHVRLPDIIGDLNDGEHVMMVGPAGTGKSTIAEHAANALGIAFRPMSICAQTTEARFFGFVNANQYIRTAMRDCWEYGGLLLIDEIDKGNPNIVSVLNAAMSNDYLTFPDGETIKRHADFIIVATANTYGRGADHRYVGSNKLDAATLDRFSVETIGYDESVETSMCIATGLNDSGSKYTVDMVLSKVRAMRNVALSSPNTQAIVSPRASVGICKKLARGRSWDDAFEVSLFKGMSKDDRAKLTVS